MKINVIRHLVVPWFAFFALAIVAMVWGGVYFPQKLNDPRIFFGAIFVGVILCLTLNIRTLNRAGIWIAHSLPSSLRYNSKPWIFRALQAGIVALAFYLLGQLTWIPLVWQAFVVPIVFTGTLFLGIWSLMGPILTWSSRVSFSRITAFMMSLPVFALVPLTAIFLGKTIVTAYLSSRPDVAAAQAEDLLAKASEPSEEAERKNTKAEKSNLPPVATSEKGKAFQALAEGGQPCYSQTKEITAALVSSGTEETVYWAIKAMKCSDIPSVVGLPHLAKIMADHPSARTRAAAIRAMPRYGYDKVHTISYLIVKRITEKESPEVMEAAASVLAKIGEEERKWAVNRLKALLDSPHASVGAAKILMEDLKQENLVTEYVSEKLRGNAEDRRRAVNMICVLPANGRSAVVPYLDQVVASVKTGAKDDPAMAALDCMGRLGFQAIRQEVVQPLKLDRPVAARALAEMNVKSSQEEALQTAEGCVRDENEQVRKWCSQSLGKIGAPALPRILDLLKSNQSELKEAGRNALNFFDDPNAQKELEKVRDENSGWMANKSKLAVAEAVNSALIKIQSESRVDEKSPSDSDTDKR